jgi:hypothetical protein
MQLMNTVFVLLSLMMNKIDSELKIINSIFNFNIKKNKMSLKINSLLQLRSMYLYPRKSSIFTNKNPIRHIKTLQSENNLSKKNLIIKRNSNIISPISQINLYANKQIIRNQINNSNNNNKIFSFSSYADNKNKSSHSNIKINENEENNYNSYEGEFTPKINLDMNYKGNNKSLKENKEFINLNLIDYFCPCGDKKKKRMIQLYLFANAFYRKRMDIVNVFTHLILTEKILIKNNFVVNDDKYFNPEI